MSTPTDPKKTPEDESTTDEIKKPHPSDYRSAVTGQFVTEAEAEGDPDRAVKES